MQNWAYRIGRHAGRGSKAITLTHEQLKRVPSPYVRISLELEAGIWPQA